MTLGNVFILGDSYSTFEGYIPEGNDIWYRPVYSEECKDMTDVCKVEQTWWKQVLDQTNSTLVLNNSYSGTTICNTGYEGADCTEISFIGRLDKLDAQGYFSKNKIDTFIIFGGTNDSWANSPVGELKYADWTKEDLFQVLPAFCYLLKRVRECVPDARVLCMINTELKEEITENFRIACDKHGVEVIAPDHISKQNGHPNIRGMREIADAVKNHLGF